MEVGTVGILFRLAERVIENTCIDHWSLPVEREPWEMQRLDVGCWSWHRVFAVLCWWPLRPLEKLRKWKETDTHFCFSLVSFRYLFLGECSVAFLAFDFLLVCIVFIDVERATYTFSTSILCKFFCDGNCCVYDRIMFWNYCTFWYLCSFFVFFLYQGNYSNSVSSFYIWKFVSGIFLLFQNW